MEEPFSLSVSSGPDSITTASSKRSANEMDEDCYDSSLDLQTSNKRFVKHSDYTCLCKTFIVIQIYTNLFFSWLQPPYSV